MSRRPFYVEQVIEPDEQATIDPVTGKWMLYRLTSIRVPGRKNPVKKRVFTAECSPEGRKELTTDLGPKPEVKAVEAWEYGLSRVLQAAFPGDWERRYPEHSEAIFLDFIHSTSPNSFLLRGKTYTLPTTGINVRLRQEMLWDFYGKKEITPQMLEPLKGIMLLSIDGKEMIMAPDEEQAGLLAKLGVSLV